MRKQDCHLCGVRLPQSLVLAGRTLHWSTEGCVQALKESLKRAKRKLKALKKAR